ncbi:MAG: hypothetical protein KKH52_00600 [Nanoarchaeota archaeon]|nr:hypothetical protein [Nanoarchaeota archaeon]
MPLVTLAAIAALGNIEPPEYYYFQPPINDPHTTETLEEGESNYCSDMFGINNRYEDTIPLAVGEQTLLENNCVLDYDSIQEERGTPLAAFYVVCFDPAMNGYNTAGIIGNRVGARMDRDIEYYDLFFQDQCYGIHLMNIITRSIEETMLE